MTRRSWTQKRKLALFEDHRGICHICGDKIDGTRERWDVEHIIPLAIGGDDDESNCAPAHDRCHKHKTSTDRRDIAKTERIRAKHQGARKPRSRLSHPHLKRKVDGSVVTRD